MRDWRERCPCSIGELSRVVARGRKRARPPAWRELSLMLQSLRHKVDVTLHANVEPPPN